ncbi:MAG: nucleotidyl transferase AbiEii/AbiGii toxin family protein [Firmicutes bacterium]|nr:nucleotidyl transferase AbiEii/AbiGii toxin family protein [Bacillota bacterium]
MRLLPFSPDSADWHHIQASAAFWDVNPDTLDPERHRVWIVHRILQFGSWEDWQALFRLYGSATIQEAVGHRGLPEHLRRFWQAYFLVDEENPPMYPQTLLPATALLWERFGGGLCPPGYVLGGGTALALMLGHRQSDDLDFMTMDAQDPAPIVQRIHALDPDAEILDRSRYSVHWRIQGVKVSYLWQPGVRIDSGPTFQEIPLASQATLAVLKCNAIANRGARKDFIDLYALLQSGWSLADILEAVAAQAPQLNRAHLLRSLVYFDDAEQEPDPRLFRPWSWPEMRHTIEQHVYAYLRRTLPPSDPCAP